MYLTVHLKPKLLFIQSNRGVNSKRMQSRFVCAARFVIIMMNAQ